MAILGDWNSRAKEIKMKKLLPEHLMNLQGSLALSPSGDEVYCSLKCHCGSEKFHVLYAGTVSENSEEPGIDQVEINGAYFLIIKVRCTLCESLHMVFDKDLHGWEGTVGRDEEQAALPRPPVEEWLCSVCQEATFVTAVKINYMDPQQFMEESFGDYDMSVWADAYSYIEFHCTCVECGTAYSPLTSYEAR
jgi:hypothetical protein